MCSSLITVVPLSYCACAARGHEAYSSFWFSGYHGYHVHHPSLDISLCVSPLPIYQVTYVYNPSLDINLAKVSYRVVNGAFAIIGATEWRQ